MTVVASAARRARYCCIETPSISSVGQEGLDGDRVGLLAGADDLGRDLVDLAVDALVEMLGFEEVRDAVERLVVDQDGAEQRLLGLDIVRGLPVALLACRDEVAEPRPCSSSLVG